MAFLLTVGIILGLFILGQQPIAINLIPSPWDKLAHICTYALLAYCIGRASGQYGRSQMAIAILGGLLIGALDEWHQGYLPGRKSQWYDLVADVMGTLIGAAFLIIKRPKHDM